MSARTPASVVAICFLAAGCGSSRPVTQPAVDRDAVAKTFARAIFRGDTRTALGLIASAQGLGGAVRRAAEPWKSHHGRVRLLFKDPGGHYVLGFSGTHPHPDGRFETVRGELVVVVGPAAIEAFSFRNTVTKFKTHHDSQLLPSDR